MRSNRLKSGLLRAMFTATDSRASYWPLGLVAARTVVLVFSLHTMLPNEKAGSLTAESQVKTTLGY